MAEKKRRRRIKLGDVYAIPLPNGKYAFGRRFKDAGIGIYKHIGENIEDIPETEDYQFIVGVYDSVLKSENWTVVDNRSFESEDDAFPPPQCVIDPISGEYSVYHKGEMRKATKAECEGMEIAAVWDEHHIIDRIMGEDKWHRDPYL
ncbi:Imm26 family immunity protein [Halalkalibacter akibai]|uniref:Immunity protein 26 of polymorphic toxin system n=1 Tax=Halalkalibacter akibai (strain ATCC 43226 / DSM 21942 / CIP 109018 / JCM 9157 / 1139) TaxID=1236973 RepID=W4R1E7_HALA3|nr:Imm26 family immunity protein [Halalkalibacter akibai]GAE37723.1 hypothetical protein JCM9157_5044 [Halalkalibacter akibai JCM 9157]